MVSWFRENRLRNATSIAEERAARQRRYALRDTKTEREVIFNLTYTQAIQLHNELIARGFFFEITLMGQPGEASPPPDAA